MKIEVDSKDIEAQMLYLRRCEYIFNQEMKRMLSRLGEEAVTEARERPQEQSFFNHTGNLRSSIGYGVYRDGRKVAKGGFELTPSPEDNGHLGVWYGRRELTKVENGTSEIASVDFNVGGSKIHLVVVAGMFYAGYVEAHDNKDVLATAKLNAQAKAKRYLMEAKQRIKERVAKIKV